MQHDAGILTRTLAMTLVLILSIGGGYWWWTHKRRPTAVATGKRAVAKHTPPKPRPLLANSNGNGNGDGPDARSPETAKTPKAAGLDLSRTSWQNPFAELYWNSRGWTFDGDSMRTTSTADAEATFRRPYRRLRLDLDIRRLTKTGLFVIRLYTAETVTATTVTLKKGRIAVHADTPAKSDALIKQRRMELARISHRG